MPTYSKDQFLIWAKSYLKYEGIRLMTEGGQPDWTIGKLALAAYISRMENSSGYLHKDRAAQVMETKHSQTTDKYIKRALNEGLFENSPQDLKKGHLIPTDKLIKAVESELSDKIDAARICLYKTIKEHDDPKDGLAWFNAA